MSMGSIFCFLLIWVSSTMVKNGESILSNASHFLPMATYNSFRQQVGFCRMQSFETISRSTSQGPRMFLDGLVTMGVGMSSLIMKSNPTIFMCGACLNITVFPDSYFPCFNHELTAWDSWDSWDSSSYSFVSMVFDECTDPICTQNDKENGFIDFDIYHSLQPVEHGNPVHLQWSWIDCPVRDGIDFIEYLICFESTCQASFWNNLSLPLVPTYFWSLTIRNSRQPIQKVWTNGTEMKLENAWISDDVLTDFQQPLSITLLSQNGKFLQDNLYLDGNLTQHHQKNIRISDAYHQGILIQSTLQN